MGNKIRKQNQVSLGFRATLLVGALIIIFLTVSQVNAEIEVPPNNDIFFQTTGRNANRNIGDYYTNVNGDGIHHLVEINIPCVPNEVFRVQLFDPEVYDAGPPSPGSTTEPVDDEVRNEGDITNFRLFDPGGNEIEYQTYGPFPQPPDPAPATHGVWNSFYTINLPANPVEGDTCGIYTIETWTGDEGADPALNDDDNAWKYRILGGPDTGNIDDETFDPSVGPDNRAGTGDEAALGIQRLSFQHNSSQEQTFYWFVDDAVSPTWTGNNFDVDEGNSGLCPTDADCEIDYISPSGATTGATESPNDEWNPGQQGRQGDQFTDTEAGLWQADVLIPVGNQYIIEIENNGKPIFLDEPILPELTITKDDGVTHVTSPGVTTYTLIIENIGAGAALPIAGPEVVDTLPPGMTFAGCAIEPPLIGTCSSPSPTVIEFDLQGQNPARNASDGSDFQPILAYLPGTDSGLVTNGTLTVIANIAPNLPASTTFTNTATVDWTDLYGNNYKPKEDTDIDLISPIDLQISKRHSPTVVAAGDNLDYTIAITNVGDVLATGVVITDQIPANTTFVSASDSGTFAAGIITWLIGGLDIDETVTRQVVVQIDNPLPPGIDTVTNTACVADDGASGPDQNPQDNCANDTTTITNTIPAVVDPTIVKNVDVSVVSIGNPVNYSITISNPSANSNTSATGVILTDIMPVEMDFITYTLSTNPSGIIISDENVTQNVVSTVGHPSGITQTIATTITISMPTLGLDESVTLNIQAEANALAGPPPLDIINVALLDHNEGRRKRATTTVTVSDGSTPTPTPTFTPTPSPNDSSDDDNDDDGGSSDNDDDGNTGTTSNGGGNTPGSSSPGAAPAPTSTPTLPVLLLPETGLQDGTSFSGLPLIGLLGVIGFGGLLLWKLLRGNSPQ
ncbi:MAG: DUF11 domain-containing protein [Anaerolineae bacterium]|nr:DUF11 domain-containing protein [Anaerolineae bacterium]